VGREEWCLGETKLTPAPTEKFATLLPCVTPTIALMMEAVHTSETSVYYNETTRRYIPESSNLLAKQINFTVSDAFIFYVFFSFVQSPPCQNGA
jgi:hypothetical protein